MRVDLEVNEAYLADVLNSAQAGWIRDLEWFPDFKVARGCVTCWDALMQGKITSVIVHEQDDGGPVYKHTVTKDRLRGGIRAVHRNCPAMLGELLGNSMQLDAASGDVLLQATIFGELKYA